MKMIYLANPYSSKLHDPDAASLERAHRRQLESYVGGKLRKKYKHAFILPIALSGAMADLCQFGTGFNEWIGDDLEFVSRCDEVWVLKSKGWKDSIGVREEIKFAKDLKKVIKYIDPQTLKVTKR